MPVSSNETQKEQKTTCGSSCNRAVAARAAALIIFLCTSWSVGNAYVHRYEFQKQVDRILLRKISRQNSVQSQREYFAIEAALRSLPAGRLFVGIWLRDLFPSPSATYPHPHPLAHLHLKNTVQYSPVNPCGG